MTTGANLYQAKAPVSAMSGFVRPGLLFMLLGALIVSAPHSHGSWLRPGSANFTLWTSPSIQTAAWTIGGLLGAAGLIAILFGVVVAMTSPKAKS